MLRFLFRFDGRVSRSRFWLGHLLLLALAVGGSVVAVLIAALASVGKQPNGDPGVIGIVAIVVAALVMACGALALLASGLCLGIRRFHDRGKPGIWVAIQFVPIIGALWYFIETGFLRGTAGRNPYGADPLAPAGDPAGGPDGAPAIQAPQAGYAPQAVYSPQAVYAPQLGPAGPAPGGRPGWVVPVMLALALPGLLVLIGSAAMAWRSHSWLAQATVLPGRIVGLEPVAATDAAKGTSYKAVIAATTPEGEAIRVVDAWASNPPPAIGEARAVAYDGSGPDHAVSVDFWSLYGWQSLAGGATAVFVVPWLAATALVAALWKRRRPQALA